MKKLVLMMVVFGMALVSNLFADTVTTVTNRNQVITIKTFNDMATDTKDLDVYQDMSTYATKPGQYGKIVRWYDFDVQGGTLNATIKLLPAIPLPDNAIIRNGMVKVVTAVTSSGTAGTMNLTANSTADLRVASTNLVTTGLSAIIPVGTAGTAIQLTAERYITTTIATAAITAGKFVVILDYELAP